MLTVTHAIYPNTGYHYSRVDKYVKGTVNAKACDYARCLEPANYPVPVTLDVTDTATGYSLLTSGCDLEECAKWYTDQMFDTLYCIGIDVPLFYINEKELPY